MPVDRPETAEEHDVRTQIERLELRLTKRQAEMTRDIQKLTESLLGDEAFQESGLKRMVGDHAGRILLLETWRDRQKWFGAGAAAGWTAAGGGFVYLVLEVFGRGS